MQSSSALQSPDPDDHMPYREASPSIVHLAAVVGLSLAAGCGEARAPLDGDVRAGLVASAEAPRCSSDSLRPATAAPAEGLWISDAPATGRVAAMIGPSRVKTGETRLTRPVATIETPRHGRSLRLSLDTAVVSLALLPPAISLGATPAGRATDGAAPAAVYAVSPRVMLASYEPCAISVAAPGLRYLRRDAGGRVVTDVMLRRTSGGNQP